MNLVTGHHTIKYEIGSQSAINVEFTVKNESKIDFLVLL